MSALLALLLASAAPAQPVCVPAHGDARVTECAVKDRAGAVQTYNCMKTENGKVCI